MEKSTCVGKLLRKMQPKCNVKDVGIMETIYQPEDNFVLFINIPTTLIESDCSKPFNITNTAILYYENCTIIINGLTYEEKTRTYSEHINISLPEFIEVIPETVTEEINLRKLKDYQFSDHNVMYSLTATTTIHQYITYTSIAIVISMVIISTICLSKKIKIIYTPNAFVEENIVRPPTDSLWPSLYSKGGGVTDSHRQPSYYLPTADMSSTN